MAPKADIAFSLPMSLVGPVDLGRLIRELETIDDALLNSSIRSGETEAQLPKVSKLMEALVEINKLSLLEADDRQQIKQFLLAVKEDAPVLHMSFSADPPPAMVEKLMTWLRREIHPVTLLTIGLQPSIGAGCVLRTTNRYFDFSLRDRFIQSRKLLVAELEGKPS